LDDFYDYLVRLNQLLPADVTPLGIHHQWWWRLASYANGGYILNPRTRVPGFLMNETLEVLDLLQRLLQEGLYLQPGWISTEEGSPVPPDGHWSFGAQFIGGSHFDIFRDEMVAITSLAPWDFHSIGNYFEFGLVPPPWGSNVTFPGDWRDLKTHTPYRSVFNDATTAMIVRGTPDVVTPEVFMNMVFTWYENRANQLINIQAELAAGTGDGIRALHQSQYLFTQADIDIWEWYANNSTWEAMDGGGFWSNQMQNAWLNTLGGTGDFRSAFEAVMPQTVWQLYDMGLLLRQNIPDAMWTQAAEFGASVDE
jgi:hypothetical protein